MGAPSCARPSFPNPKPFAYAKDFGFGKFTPVALLDQGEFRHLRVATTGTHLPTEILLAVTRTVRSIWERRKLNFILRKILRAVHACWIGGRFLQKATQKLSKISHPV